MQMRRVDAENDAMPPVEALREYSSVVRRRKPLRTVPLVPLEETSATTPVNSSVWLADQQAISSTQANDREWTSDDTPPPSDALPGEIVGTPLTSPWIPPSGAPLTQHSAAQDRSFDDMVVEYCAGDDEWMEEAILQYPQTDRAKESSHAVPAPAAQPGSGYQEQPKQSRNFVPGKLTNIDPSDHYAADESERDIDEMDTLSSPSYSMQSSFSVERHADSTGALSRLGEVNPIILPVHTRQRTGRMNSLHAAYEEVETAELPTTSPLAASYGKLLPETQVLPIHLTDPKGRGSSLVVKRNRDVEREHDTTFMMLLGLLALGILGALWLGYLLSWYGITY